MLSEFLQMGGYGAYVWPAWGIAAATLAALAVASVRTMRAREKELAALEADRRGAREDRPE